MSGLTLPVLLFHEHHTKRQARWITSNTNLSAYRLFAIHWIEPAYCDDTRNSAISTSAKIFFQLRKRALCQDVTPVGQP